MADGPAPGSSPSLRTALHGEHERLGARFTHFGGWEMPVRYGSIIDEHHAVRRSAGLFDLSHMGELVVSGAGAGDGLAHALVRDPRRLAVGQAHYSLLCTADGGVIDDLIVYRLADREYLVVCNAANRAPVVAELTARLAGHAAALEDRTMATSLVAVQGPAAAGILGRLTSLDLGGLRYYAIASGEVAGLAARVARTGYTGEDGFEILVAWDDGPPLWRALLAAGDGDLLPCGLGARDTLRLEAGMPLYGQELDRETDPFAAGLGRVVELRRDEDFIGRAALEAASAAPPRRQLVGLVLRARGIARHGYPIAVAGSTAPIGAVTSGSQSPTLDAAIAMAYVAPEAASPGTMLAVGVREAWLPAEVVELPFYRRPIP